MWFSGRVGPHKFQDSARSALPTPTTGRHDAHTVCKDLEVPCNRDECSNRTDLIRGFLRSKRKVLTNLPERFSLAVREESRRAKTPAKLSAAKWRPDSIYFWCIPAERMEKPNSQTMFRWEESPPLILLECQQLPSATSSLFFPAPLLPFPLAFRFRGALSSFRRRNDDRDSNTLVASNGDKNADHRFRVQFPDSLINTFNM